MKDSRLCLAIVLAALVSFLAACAEMTPAAKPAASGGSKNVIRVGSPFKAGHILVDAGEKFKELIEKGSNGRIQVQVDAGVKSEEEINDWCSKGQMEMQSNGHRAPRDLRPPVFLLQRALRDERPRPLHEGLEREPGKEGAGATEKNGNVMYLGIVYRGLRQTTAKKPVYTPADAYNMKLRLPTVKTWIAVWKEIGADPIPIPLPELYKSLKEAKAESSEGDLPQIASFKLDEVQSHLIITNHWSRPAG